MDIQNSIVGSSSAYHKDLKSQTDSLDVACNDGGHPYGLEKLGTDHANRSSQAAVIREESKGDSGKLPGNRSPIRFR